MSVQRIKSLIFELMFQNNRGAVISEVVIVGKTVNSSGKRCKNRGACRCPNINAEMNAARLLCLLEMRTAAVNGAVFVISSYANYGICVSSGSACAKGKRSHVLTAMGLPEQVIDKSIRLSFSGQSTQAEADAFVDALRDLVKKHPKE